MSFRWRMIHRPRPAPRAPRSGQGAQKGQGATHLLQLAPVLQHRAQQHRHLRVEAAACCRAALAAAAGGVRPLARALEPLEGGEAVDEAAWLASRAARTTPGSLGRTYKRWSAEEEAYFLGLCEKHGEGKWAQMLAEGQRAGKLRADLTSVHLKDKYRNLKTKRATRRPSRA